MDSVGTLLGCSKVLLSQYLLHPTFYFKRGNMKQAKYIITIKWWVEEKAFTEIICDEDIVDTILSHYSHIGVREIIIERYKTNCVEGEDEIGEECD